MWKGTGKGRRNDPDYVSEGEEAVGTILEVLAAVGSLLLSLLDSLIPAAPVKTRCQ